MGKATQKKGKTASEKAAEQGAVPAPPSEFQMLSSTGEEESMVFSATELYEHERFMREWFSENMPEYKDFQKSVVEYTAIYNTAGDILEYYHNKENLTAEDMKLVKYALDVRQCYLNKLTEIYAKSASSLSALKKQFEERVIGCYRAKYLALFNGEISSLKKMSKTKPEYNDIMLARRIKHKPKERETSLSFAEGLKKRAEEIRANDVKQAEDKLDKGIRMIQEALDALKTSLNTTQINQIKSQLAELGDVLKNSGREGKISRETADNIVVALKQIQAGFEEQIAARRKEEQKRQT